MDRDVSTSTLEATVPAQSSSGIEAGATSSPRLEHIAAALDIPAEALVRLDRSHGDRARVLAENAEALKIFTGMMDPTARQRGLAYLRWIAEQDGIR